MRLRFPNKDEISTLWNSSIVAVDLGFTEKSKSCGIACRTSDGTLESGRLDFGQCVKKTAAFLSSNEHSVLIVEAPLSGLLNERGNPVGRKLFEKRLIEGKSVSRYWYVGAGAAVSLGAIFFFSRLASLLHSESVVVNVVEGFISFKTRRSEDEEDALALLEGLRCPGSVELYNVGSDEGKQPVNMLSFAGLASEEDPCPVVMVVTV